MVVQKSVHQSMQNISKEKFMKDKIPFYKFYDYIKNQLKPNLHPTHEEFVEYHKAMNEQFKLMEQVEWQDLENCTKDEMAIIPISWIYDWDHITGGADQDAEKIKNLYRKHNLSPFDLSDLQTRIIFMKAKTKEEYFYEIKKLLSKKFEDKSVEEISNLPIETLITKTDDTTKETEFKQQHQKLMDTLTKKYDLSKKMSKKSHQKTKRYDDEMKVKFPNTLQGQIDKIISSGNICKSMLQRIFRIGYPKASSIIETLEKNKIIEFNKTTYNILEPEKLKKFLLEKFS